MRENRQHIHFQLSTYLIQYYITIKDILVHVFSVIGVWLDEPCFVCWCCSNIFYKCEKNQHFFFAVFLIFTTNILRRLPFAKYRKANIQMSSKPSIYCSIESGHQMDVCMYLCMYGLVEIHICMLLRYRKL